MDFRVVPIILSVPSFYHMGAVLSPSVITTGLTYTGIREAKQEVDAIIPSAHMFDWYTEKYKVV